MKTKGVALVPLLFFSACVFAAESGNAEQATKHDGRLPAQEKEASFSAPVSEAGADGLFWQTEDDSFKIKVGGEAQYDYGWVDDGGAMRDLGLDAEDQGQYRRTWLETIASYQDWLEFVSAFDFAPNHTRMKDFYLKVKGLPVVGNLYFGNIKEPMNLEDMTSNKNITFLERGLPYTFVPGRSWGGMAQNAVCDDRMTWALGVFHNAEDNALGQWGNPGNGNSTSATGRMTFLPYYENDGQQCLHLGASYSFRSTPDPVSFGSGPETETALVKSFTSTGNINADHVNLVGAEAAWVNGPLSFQSEFMAAAVDADSGEANLFLPGMYILGSYFLTGETRPYDKELGIFGDIKPKANFLADDGPGAWELALRYSYLDLNDGDVGTTGNRVQDVTWGVNWYLNPNMRISGNYVRSYVDGPLTSDWADLFVVRLQLVF